MSTSRSNARTLLPCSSTFLLAYLIFAYLIFGGQTFAQTQTTDPAVEVPNVTVGTVTGIPGAIVLVPLYYTPDPNLSLRSLIVDINYISNSLEFQAATRGLPLTRIEADLETTLSEGTPDERGIARSNLRVMISMTEKTASPHLPKGLLAYLTFLISLDAKPFRINLAPSVASAEEIGTSLQAQSRLNVQPGTVAVQVGEVTPLAGCFFYMH